MRILVSIVVILIATPLAAKAQEIAKVNEQAQTEDSFGANRRICDSVRSEYEVRSQEIASKVRDYFNQELRPLLASKNRNALHQLDVICANAAAKAHAFHQNTSNATFNKLGVARANAKKFFDNLVQENIAAMIAKANLINSANGPYHVKVLAKAGAPEIEVFYDLTNGNQAKGLQVIETHMEACNRGNGPGDEAFFSTRHSYWVKDSYTQLNFDDPSRTTGEHSFVSRIDGVDTYKDGLFNLNEWALAGNHLDSSCGYGEPELDFLRRNGPLISAAGTTN